MAAWSHGCCNTKLWWRWVNSALRRQIFVQLSWLSWLSYLAPHPVHWIGPLHELCIQFQKTHQSCTGPRFPKISYFCVVVSAVYRMCLEVGGGVQQQCIMYICTCIYIYIYIHENSVLSSDRITCYFRSWIQINWLQTSGGLLVSVPNARALRRSWWHLWSLQHAQSHWCLQQQLVPQIKRATIRDILLQSFAPVQAFHVCVTISCSNRVWKNRKWHSVFQEPRLLRSEDMYSGTSWAVIGLSSVALTKIRLLTSQVWFCDLRLLALALRWSLLPLHWSASCKLAAADDRATKEGPGLRLYEGLWGHEAVSWSEIVGCERRIARLASGMIQFPACLCNY